MKRFFVYAVSDATGGLSNKLAIAACHQFTDINFKIVRKGKVTDQKKIEEVVLEAKECHGVIIFTMVSQELRRRLLSEAKKKDVVAMDVMGPTLDVLSNYFHKLPSGEPGLQYKITHDYFKRTESVEFTIRHDDGHELDTVNQADIILLGISRTSKTPLSIYLAYQGYRCANVPIISGVPINKEILKLDRKKMVGLIVAPDKLVPMRSSRLKKLGRPDTEHYAKKEHIVVELQYAQEVFKKLKLAHVIDMTNKAIEEVSSEIMQVLGL